MQRGEEVRLRADPTRVGIVRQVHESDAGVFCEVFFNADESATYPEHALAATNEELSARDPIGALKAWRFATPERFRTFLTLTKLSQPLADTIYSYLASRTQLLAYQFKPVLKLLASPYGRILIADEVGLGKTIEAGIVLTEYHARQSLERVVICCPSALRDKWKSEMRDRFDWDFDVLSGHELRERFRETMEYPGQPLRVVASIESLRRPENVVALQDDRMSLDLVIVDEAHHMRNHGTMTNTLGSQLSEVADLMVFLTATPLNLGRRDFFELMRLLVPEEFGNVDDFEVQLEPNKFLNEALRALRLKKPDLAGAAAALDQIKHLRWSARIAGDPRFQEVQGALAKRGGGLDRETRVRMQRHLLEMNSLSHVFTRTKKREVSTLFPMRRATPVPVNLSSDEKAFYEAVSDWVRAEAEGKGQGAASFALTMVQRQVASCMPAMVEKLTGLMASRSVVFTRDEMVDEEEVEGRELGEEIFEEFDEADLEPIDRIQSLWPSVVAWDSKFEAFSGALETLLRAGQRKILVFSYFIGTIDYLASRISKLRVDGQRIEVLRLYGPTPQDERATTVARFRDSDQPVVMISSEVGSEGLDFQFCAAMVNYDLPWNPMRVEQRIGRLDRYGQDAEAIDIVNLVVNDTIEGRIFYRLYDRIKIFEESIGDLEAILGDVDLDRALKGLKQDLLFGRLTPAEQERRADLIADAIVTQQQEHDEFDKQSRQFVGQDEVFSERFHDIEAGRRYVSSAEVRNLVEQFIATRELNVRLGRVTRDAEVARLKGRDLDRVYATMQRHLQEDRAASRLDWQLAARLCSEAPPALTFDAATAARDRTLEFISIKHPLIRAIRSAMVEDDALPPATIAEVKATADLRPGHHFFFLYQLTTSGIKPAIELIPVVVDEEGRVEPDAGSSLLPVLADGEAPASLPDAVLTPTAIDRAAAVATAHIHANVQQREDEAKAYAASVVDAQLESLEISFQRRRATIDERLLVEREPRIRRLLEGQKRNMTERHERKRREIEGKSDAAVGSRLIAAGVLLVSR